MHNIDLILTLTGRRAGGDAHTGELPIPPREQHRAIVVGYGPVGQTVTRLLRENEIEPIIIELNVETVQRLKAEGTHAIYGDATRVDTLTQAGVADARALVLSSSSIKNGREILRMVRELNPKIHILARTAHLRERDRVHAALFSREEKSAAH